MKKNFNCIYNEKDVGTEVTLHGWVSKVRDLGGLIFIDLRDRSGIIQVVVNPESEIYEVAKNLKNESVISVIGTIGLRSSINNNLTTGKIEVIASSIDIITSSKEIPFSITDDTTALEDTRLKYRYLDLRRPKLAKNLAMRHKIMLAVRNYLDNLDFLEIETPILCKSTPEGARDYLVPSRVNKDKFYALPQSPQLFKQLLMVGGIERYFQITKCFRDEDLRRDRQPEFTQVDIELSFVNQDDVMHIAENLVKDVFTSVSNISLGKFSKMKYVDAIKNYGSDKPDLRFDMPIIDINEVFENTSIEFFKNKEINCLVVKNVADKYSRKDIDKLVEFVKNYKASGLAFLKFTEKDGLTGSISKLLSDSEAILLTEKLCLENNDLVLIVSDTLDVVKNSLGYLRCKLGSDLSLYKSTDLACLWVVDFPAFEYSEEQNRFVASHHPFTMPLDCDIDKLISDKENCYSKAYDMVINGYEVAGGSIRIHDCNVQKLMFEALELTEEDITDKFGFFVEALNYGTPPHGGIAFGLDRLTMILSNTENIRDVIAFPKTSSASCLMSECPSNVVESQLDDLHISLKVKKD